MFYFYRMYYVRMLFFYLALASLAFLAIGLWRPWVMLWWEDLSNRRKVIQVYGILAVSFYIIYRVLLLI